MTPLTDETVCRFFDPSTGDLARDLPSSILIVMGRLEGRSFRLGDAVADFRRAVGLPLDGSPLRGRPFERVTPHLPLMDLPGIPGDSAIDFGLITYSTRISAWNLIKFRSEEGRILVVKTMGDLKGIRPLEIRE